MKFIRIKHCCLDPAGYVRVLAGGTIHHFKPIQPRVKIEVSGGVAECTRATKGITVTIQDHDNEATAH